MSNQIPTTTKAFVLGAKQTRTLNGKDIPYHDASLEERPIKYEEGQVVLKVLAAGFNHREVWIRKGLYPKTKEGTVMGADASGIVIAGPPELLNKRVFAVPMIGWESDPLGPEKELGVLGGTMHPPIGTLAEYMVLPAESVIPVPEHMTDEEAASWGLGAVTAWRAVVTKGQVQKGYNVFITGIGGGLALIALMFCLALGANVFVSSSSQETIDKAVKLGAKGGVNYRNESWPQDLAALLKEHNVKGLDRIIDSAGGDILDKTIGILNNGAKLVCFGMTASPSIPVTMAHVLKNIDLLGSTMGSTAEPRAATEFAAEHKLRPIVSDVIDGLENSERAFEVLTNGKNFGKVVVRVDRQSGSEPKF